MARYHVLKLKYSYALSFLNDLQHININFKIFVHTFELYSIVFTIFLYLFRLLFVKNVCLVVNFVDKIINEFIEFYYKLDIFLISQMTLT